MDGDKWSEQGGAAALTHSCLHGPPADPLQQGTDMYIKQVLLQRALHAAQGLGAGRVCRYTLCYSGSPAEHYCEAG